jgi:four helix bundle protein
MTAPATLDPLQRVQAYRLAMDAMREARLDAQRAKKDVLTREVGGQLLRAAGSIGANIAEGYSRGTTSDRRKFYEYALGSVRECIVWYETLPESLPASRIERLVSIRRLLLTMIRNARKDAGADSARVTR